VTASKLQKGARRLSDLAAELGYEGRGGPEALRRSTAGQMDGGATEKIEESGS
jgi:hypothetical protein